MGKKSRRKVRKSRDIIRESKQLLSRASKESLRRSRNILKKISNESLKRASYDNINKSLSNIQKSSSREHLTKTKSKSGLYDKGRNLSSQNVSQGLSSNGNSSVNRQQMQNYLISQVIFDGKEDVRTSRMHMAHKPCAILEDDFAETCEEKKKKEEEKKERKKNIEEKKMKKKKK